MKRIGIIAFLILSASILHAVSPAPWDVSLMTSTSVARVYMNKGHGPLKLFSNITESTTWWQWDSTGMTFPDGSFQPSAVSTTTASDLANYKLKVAIDTTTEASARSSGDYILGQGTATNAANISAEQAARQAGDLAIGISTATEALTRQNADYAIGQATGTERSERIAGDIAIGISTATEAATRQAADYAIGQTTATNASNIATETSNRIAGDVAIGISTATEALTRANADVDIYTNINGTYTYLLNLSTTQNQAIIDNYNTLESTSTDLYTKFYQNASTDTMQWTDIYNLKNSTSPAYDDTVLKSTATDLYTKYYTNASTDTTQWTNYYNTASTDTAQWTAIYDLQNSTETYDDTAIKNSTGNSVYLIAAFDSDPRIKARADWVCDGTADQTEFQLALNGGNKLLQVAQGTYNLTTGVIMYSSTTITGLGKPIIRKNTTGSMLSASGLVDNITIENLYLEHLDTDTPSSNRVINITNTLEGERLNENIVIRNNTILTYNGTRMVGVTNSSSVWITNNSFPTRTEDADATDIIGCANVNITGNTSRNRIHIEASRGIGSNFVISGNIVDRAQKGGIYVYNMSSGTISGNVLTSCDNYGLEINGGDGSVLITGNQASGNAGGETYIEYPEQVTDVANSWNTKQLDIDGGNANTDIDVNGYTISAGSVVATIVLPDGTSISSNPFSGGYNDSVLTSTATDLYTKYYDNASTDTAQWTDYYNNASTDTAQWTLLYQQASTDTALWTGYYNQISTDLAQWTRIYDLENSTSPAYDDSVLKSTATDLYTKYYSNASTDTAQWTDIYDLKNSTGNSVYLIAGFDSDQRIKARADWLCDGTADQTEFQLALNGGNKTILVAHGTYNLSSAPLIIYSSTTITGLGKPRIILGVTGKMFTIPASIMSNITIENLYLEHAGAGMSSNNGCIYLDPGLSANMSTNINIRNNTIIPTNCIAGIFVSYSTGVYICNNYIPLATDYKGIHTAGCFAVTISGNISRSAIQFTASTRIGGNFTIANNIIYGGTQSGLSLYNAYLGSGTITGNTINGFATYGLNIPDTGGSIVITGNTATGNATANAYILSSAGIRDEANSWNLEQLDIDGSNADTNIDVNGYTISAGSVIATIVLPDGTSISSNPFTAGYNDSVLKSTATDLYTKYYSNASTDTAQWTDYYSNASTDTAQWTLLYQQASTDTALWTNFYNTASTDTAQWSKIYDLQNSTSPAYNDSVLKSTATDLYTKYYTNSSTDTAQWTMLYQQASTNTALWTNYYTSNSTDIAQWTDIYDLKNSTSPAYNDTVLKSTATDLYTKYYTNASTDTAQWTALYNLNVSTSQFDIVFSSYAETGDIAEYFTRSSFTVASLQLYCSSVTATMTYSVKCLTTAKNIMNGAVTNTASSFSSAVFTSTNTIPASCGIKVTILSGRSNSPVHCNFLYRKQIGQ